MDRARKRTQQDNSSDNNTRNVSSKNNKRHRNMSTSNKVSKNKNKGKKNDSDDDMDIESESEEIIVDNNSDDDEDISDMEVEDNKGKAVYRPGVDNLEEDEELDYDPSTYDLYAKLNLDWPCLSIDILNDGKGACRTEFPFECTVVAGTQGENPEDNLIYIMKWSKLHKTKEDDSDEESDEESEEEEDPEMDHQTICHPHTVNRIRAMPQGNLCATWSEDKNVYMWNLNEEVAELEKGNTCDPNKLNKKKPLFSFDGHGHEGFGMAWNPNVIGKFVSGDNNGAVKLWTPVDGGWKIDEQSFVGPKPGQGSIEDLMWKRKGINAEHVFASACSDGAVRIYDIRDNKRDEKLKIQAHQQDVNVLAWNPLVGELLVTGSDDGSFKVFDIRHSADHMAHFDYHRGPITSVSWHPTDETGLCVSSADNTVTLWDMAVEEDEEDEGAEKLEGMEEFPPQLLFLHQGQKNVMEAMWNPFIPGMVISTALDGFNVFKANNF